MTDITRVLSDLQTEANPKPSVLLAARMVVQASEGIRQTFLTARQEGWDAASLAAALAPALESEVQATPAEALEAARYLSDEYLSDPDHLLVISRETGRAVARLTEEDLWEPPPAEREDGTLVPQPKRIRPDLESFLIQWTYDRKREEDAYTALSLWEQRTSTAQILTYRGRKTLAERLRESLPSILSNLRGSAGQFLSTVSYRPEADQTVPEGFVSLPRFQVTAEAKYSLADLRSFNFRYDVFESIRPVLGVGWVCEAARHLAERSPTHIVDPVDPYRHAAWAANSDWVNTLTQQSVPSILITGVVSLGLDAGSAILQVHPDSYQVNTYEESDEWVVQATVDCTWWVRWDGCRAYMTPRQQEYVTTVVH